MIFLESFFEPWNLAGFKRTALKRDKRGFWNGMLNLGVRGGVKNVTAAKTGCEMWTVRGVFSMDEAGQTKGYSKGHIFSVWEPLSLSLFKRATNKPTCLLNKQRKQLVAKSDVWGCRVRFVNMSNVIETSLLRLITEYSWRAAIYREEKLSTRKNRTLFMNIPNAHRLTISNLV